MNTTYNLPEHGLVDSHVLDQASDLAGDSLQALLGLQDGSVDVLHPLHHGVRAALCIHKTKHYYMYIATLPHLHFNFLFFILRFLKSVFCRANPDQAEISMQIQIKENDKFVKIGTYQ